MDAERPVSDAPDEGPERPVSVLLVDDDEIWARTNARLLDSQREAFAVTTATDLAEASDVYATLDPDCVVCDYQLERGTGLDLLAEVREHDPDRPFVLVTGEGSEAVASDAIGQRVTDYVRKSVIADRTALLARRIETAVQAHRAERALERERRSKNAMIDIMTATTSRQGLARDFCQHLITERGYATAWLGTWSPGDGVVPQSVAGEERYLDAVVPPGTDPDAGDEPALVALAEGRPYVVASIDPPDTRESADRDGPDPTAWRHTASACGFQSAAAVPVAHDGSVVGVLAVYASEEAAIDARERDLLADYGTTIGFAFRTAEWKQSLLSASPVTAEVVVRDDDVPLVALSRRLPAGATVTVRTAVVRNDSQLLYVVRVAGASVVAVESAAADLDAVELVAGDDGKDSRQVELVASGPTPERLLVDAGGRFVETVVEGGRAAVSIATAGHEAVSELEAVLDRRYADVSVASIRSGGEVGESAPLDDLTAKQRQALELAFYEGYFERPRRNNATEIAGRLDVTRATFTQHVRSAERKLLDRLLDRST